MDPGERSVVGVRGLEREKAMTTGLDAPPPRRNAMNLLVGDVAILAPRLYDDRGRPFRLHRGWVRRHRRSVWDLYSKRRSRTIVWFAGVCALGGLSIVFVVASWRGGLYTPYQMLPFAMLAYCAVLAALGARRTTFEWRDLLSASDRCAACGYSLAGAVAEGDGCCVCPECGAAWRVGG